MEYSGYLIGLVALAISPFLYRLRKRVKRRRDPNLDIPEFLSGRPDAPNNLLGSSEAE